jgi:hypothetical protein
MLYTRELHEPLTDRAWDEAWARDAIAAIVADADSAYGDLWPADPNDAAGVSHTPLKDVYCGAAGVVWALAELGSSLDLPRIAHEVVERYREAPDTVTGVELPREHRSSLLCGEGGILFVACKLASDESLERDLRALVDANLTNETNELMWGVPGTLMIARAMGWSDAVDAAARALRDARDADGLWTQNLHGHETQMLGPVHGFVGNVAALGDSTGAAAILAQHALRENGHVNWLPAPTDPKIRLQWCHGAPGIVTTATAYLDEDLLLGGAQLTWDAGPFDAHAKGVGLCHGTAGNGYALLKAFERTQDELWLERARAFAVHALEQVQRLEPRYSLLSGGIGAALFAADCVSATPRFPIVDRL